MNSLLFIILTVILMYITFPILLTGVSTYIRNKKLDNFADSWFKEDKNIELYNRFVTYLTTDVDTGLYVPFKYYLPKIYSPLDYFNLQGEDRIVARSILRIIREVSKTDNIFNEFKNEIDKYLQQAEINKKLNGF